MICAGFSANSSLMKADSIVSLAYLIDQFYEKSKLGYPFIKELNSVVLLLLREKNKEVMKAIVHFEKKYLKILKKDQVAEELGMILGSLYKQDDNLRDSFRTPLKHLI